jgi:uncharacterized protein
MEIVWDAEKDAQNRAKHGVGLGDAVFLDWEGRLEYSDDRQDYGEDRMRAFAKLDARLHVCVYTIRMDQMRVISLRKANTREVKHYEQTRTR